jgi:hypothetical protein
VQSKNQDGKDGTFKIIILTGHWSMDKYVFPIKTKQRRFSHTTSIILDRKDSDINHLAFQLAFQQRDLTHLESEFSEQETFMVVTELADEKAPGLHWDVLQEKRKEKGKFWGK